MSLDTNASESESSSAYSLPTTSLFLTIGLMVAFEELEKVACKKLKTTEFLFVSGWANCLKSASFIFLGGGLFFSGELILK